MASCLFPSSKNCLLFLIISASLISSISAGRRSGVFSGEKQSTDEILKANEASTKIDKSDEEFGVHERLLRVNTHDYGRYDPTPSLHRPRHKLIPN